MKKVLIVDDTKNIRTLLTKCLQMEGYEVKTASEGLEAIELFSKETFELVFLDIKMPFKSGTEVLKQIREMGITTPVIIITAYATVKNAVECTQMGAVAYLQKPFTAEKVRNMLAELQNTKGAASGLADNYKSIADKLIQEKRYIEVLQFLKKVLSEKPLEAQVYLYLAQTSERLGSLEEANKYYKLYDSIKQG